MQVTTGGADPANPTPGVQLNFVLRSGTNRWRASGRVLLREQRACSRTTSAAPRRHAPELQPHRVLQGLRRRGRRADRSKDKLWVWGAYGKTNPAMEIYTYRARRRRHRRSGRIRAARARPAAIRRRGEHVQHHARATARCWRTTRPRWTARSPTTGVRTSPTSAATSRSSAAARSATRPAPTTWNQDGPTDMFKGEVNYTMSNSDVPDRPLRLHGRRLLVRAGRRPRHAAVPGRRTASGGNSLPVLRDRSSAEQPADRRQPLPRQRTSSSSGSATARPRWRRRADGRAAC